MENPKPHKILIATGIFPPDIGGPASYVPKIASALSQQTSKVTVITYSDVDIADRYSYRVIRVKRGKSPLWRYFKFYLQILKHGLKCDLIYAQCPIASGLPVVLANFILRKKCVIKIVGDAAWETAQNKGWTTDSLDEFTTKKYSGKINFLKKLQRFSIRRFDQIIVPSNYLKKIVSHYVNKHTAEKIHVIYNSFDRVPFEKVDITQIKRQRNLENKKIILTVGRLVNWKNIDQIICSLSHLGSNAVLIIVGDGPNRQSCQNLVAELSLTQRVKFIGNTTKRELYELYQIADCFVLISSYEGMSHTLLEAMYMGLPTVVSTFGGNPETIKDYPAAFMIEKPNDHLKVAEAITEAFNLSKEDFPNEFVIRKFGYDVMIEKTIAILAS